VLPVVAQLLHNTLSSQTGVWGEMLIVRSGTGACMLASCIQWLSHVRTSSDGGTGRAAAPRGRARGRRGRRPPAEPVCGRRGRGRAGGGPAGEPGRRRRAGRRARLGPAPPAGRPGRPVRPAVRLPVGQRGRAGAFCEFVQRCGQRSVCSVRAAAAGAATVRQPALVLSVRLNLQKETCANGQHPAHLSYL
jgi:hypothetical protein